jgi:P-type Ca2+ transporter type 2C
MPTQSADAALLCLLLQTELGDLASYDGEHHRAHEQLQDPANYARIESGLTFLGLAGLMDPPRPEVSC